MKKRIGLVLCVATCQAFASGIPTIDVAAVTQLQQQLTQLKQQYDQLKSIYSATTGSYGRGALGLTQSLNASQIVPGSWQDVVQQQAQGAYGAKQQQYEALIKTLPPSVFQNPTGRSATSYKMSSDAVRAAMAGGDSLYSVVQTHLNNLQALSAQVDQTTNLKDAQDLQNRIQVENGFVQTALAKMNAMNMNLQANALNDSTQGQAVAAKFFHSGSQ